MFRKPYLVQRLLKPYKTEEVKSEKASLLKKMANAFSFGGGLINGGISNGAMEKISKIWRYDYMGAAEFEFGAVPESLERMAKGRKGLTAGSIEVTAKAYEYAGLKRKLQKAESNVFYVCPKSIEENVREWIPILADETGKDFHTKEGVFLAQNVLGREYHTERVGWHDISNDFLFFTDRQMFEGFCSLLGVGLPAVETT
jgi:hypothetical protein